MNEKPEGTCLKCKKDLKKDALPLVPKGGAVIGNINFYYCGNSECENFGLYARYSND